MAVVKNLMIRIGADYSPAKKAMAGASKELTKFRKDTEKTTDAIKGPKGLAGAAAELQSIGGELSASFSRLRGAKGIGGVASETKTLIPILGRAGGAMAGLGRTAGATGGRLAALAGPLGIVAAVLGVVAAASSAASQEAMKFESTIGRLNMQLKGGSRDFMQWARAQGLAKQTAADLGATYGTILSSFISDTKELQTQTKHITQATRILVSGTGRPIEEVLERVRSGLLGNTEAIEDLGVFVNIAMIESTAAFKKFANGKSWDQLDFRVQQQIRLAAILEQTYARYGTTLQQNTMGKQSMLIEQLKDIKLHLSQAFLPIWDSVLPALLKLAEKVAGVTETIARFIFKVRGWDYDEMTQGTNQQTDAVSDQGKAYDDLGKSAAKARKELASFDELNLIGDPGAGSGGGAGGGSGPSLPGMPPGGGNGPGGGWQPPIVPPLPKQRIEFDPPRPPDAGAGAVATAVTSTFNALAAETRKTFSEMWKELDAKARVDAPALRGVLAAAFTGMALGAATATGQIRVNWSGMMENLSSIKSPLANIRLDWHGTLDTMQRDLNAYRPYLEWGWKLIGQSVAALKLPLADIRLDWKSTLQGVETTATTILGGVVSAIQGVTSAWEEMLRSLQKSPSPAPVPNAAPTTLGQEKTSMVGADPSRAPALNMGVAKESFVSSLMSGLSSAFSGQNLAAIQGLIQAEAAKPQNKTALALYTSLIGGGQLAKFGAGALGKVKSIWEGMKGVGNAIPAFATGGAVFGPTLAMVGDNPNARTDPEIIAPQSMLDELIGGDNAETVAVLRQILSAVERGQNVQVAIAESDIGRASVNYIRGESRRGRNPLMGV